ncbi:MAG: hypothetical protein ACKO34_02740 [Vampirovibrionales bacterium]
MPLLSPHQHTRLKRTLLEVATQALAPHPYTVIATDVEDAFGQLGVQIFVERLAGQGRITLDECAKVSALLDPVIDPLAELQAHRYCLEVSSPGLFRHLQTDRELSYYANLQATVNVQKLENVTEALSPEAVTFLQQFGLQAGKLLHVDGLLATIGVRSEGGEETRTTLIDVATLPAGVGICLAPHVDWPNDDETAMALSDEDDGLESPFLTTSLEDELS